jgi:sec-independent protein translocase protein TatC
MEELDETKAPLMEHLIELRSRLLWSAVAFALAFGVSLYFARPIFAWLAQPLLDAGQKEIYQIKVFEAFFSQMKVAFFAALMISFPVLATQIWRFVAPGLYAKEKRAFLPFLMMTPILFTAGAALAYYVTIPVALKFLLGYGGQLGGITQKTLPGVGDYLDFATKFIFGFGLAFQLPVLLMLLERAGILTLAQLKSGRRYAIVGMAAVSAVLTPPDLLSQILLLVPLILLYEFAIVGIWFTGRSRNGAAEGEAKADPAP